MYCTVRGFNVPYSEDDSRGFNVLYSKDDGRGLNVLYSEDVSGSKLSHHLIHHLIHYPRYPLAQVESVNAHTIRYLTSSVALSNILAITNRWFPHQVSATGIQQRSGPLSLVRSSSSSHPPLLLLSSSHPPLLLLSSSSSHPLIHLSSSSDPPLIPHPPLLSYSSHLSSYYLAFAPRVANFRGNVCLTSNMAHFREDTISLKTGHISSQTKIATEIGSPRRKG
jgi:hypothetical protein